MAVAFTGEGSTLYADRQVAELPLIIDRVSIGTLVAGDRYDAVATQTTLADATPTNFATQFNLIANGPWVILTLILDAADAITASEIGLFSGNTLVLVVADATDDIFTKVAGTAHIFSFLWQIVNGTPATPTINVSPYAIASETQAVAGLLNNVLSSPLRVAQQLTAWWVINGTKLSLRNIISMATAQQARAGSGDGVMTAELTKVAIASLVASDSVVGSVELATSTELLTVLTGADPPASIENNVITLQNIYDRRADFTYKVLGSGFVLTRATPVDITLPDSGVLSDFSYVLMNLGDSLNSIEESLWVPRARIPESATAGGQLYMADGFTNRLYTVNPATGIATLVGLLSAMVGGGVGLAYDGTTAYLSDDNTSRLYTVNLGSGIVTLVGATGVDGYGLAFHNGILYLGDENSGNIYTVNPATGAVTLLGATGVAANARGYGLTSHLGSLCLTTYDNLYTISTATGRATLVGATGITFSLGTNGLASQGGVLYLVTNSNLYSLNAGTGTATLIGALGVIIGDGVGFMSTGVVVFFHVSNYAVLVRNAAQTQLRIIPTQDGYCHSVLGVR